MNTNEEMVEIPRRSLARIHERNKALDTRCQKLEKEIEELKNEVAKPKRNNI